MEEPRSFYVTLVSVNDAREFPDNNAASFKARLPSPLPNRPEDWEVGLAGLFLPGMDTPSNAAVSSARLRNLLDGLTDGTELFHLRAILDSGETLQGDYSIEDALQLPQPNTGVDWLHRVIDRLMQSLLIPIPHGKRWWKNDKKTTMTFRWEGEDLLIDNENTMLTDDTLPYFSIDATVALRMGWIVRGDIQPTGSGYHLGNNLLMELPDPQATIPDPSTDRIDPVTGWSFARQYAMNVHDGRMYLSNAFNWRFVRLNEAFAAWDQHDAVHEKAVFVYSDVVRSNLMGDTMTNLLRIVPYKGESQWWEPRHIEFHPLRGPSLTIVEVNLAWFNADLLSFPTNAASHLRLLFRRRR